MTPKLSDICDALERIAPSRMAEEWDNPGLQIGNYSTEIRQILVALDPTLKAVMETSRRGAQLLLTHHPLIFSPLRHLDLETGPGNIISEALAMGISIVSAHTNLDVARGGINDMLAGLFDLHEVEVLDTKNDGGDTGLGRIGNLSGPLCLDDMVGKVKRALDLERVKVVGAGDRAVGRVAVVGGSGGRMVRAASTLGADLLITGDVGHHDALEAEGLGLALIDGGHFHTEKAALRLFTDRFRHYLRDSGWDVTVETYDAEVSPARYD